MEDNIIDKIAAKLIEPIERIVARSFERAIEKYIANSIEDVTRKIIEIGVINTLSHMGHTPEIVTESQARKQYGSRYIDRWRSKRWIVGYPSANSERAKVYFKRTELETASRMLDIQNAVPANKIFNHAKAK